jgi:hypothetical protein
VDLLGRIDRRLADTRARIDPHDFEDCATSMLTSMYPGLVPIVGGTDHGLDAEIFLDARPTGLIITSSRTLEGARSSLRSSLASVNRHRLPVRHVMVANLAEMNRRRRDGMAAIAKEFDCELVQIFDRAFFANQFREQPDWRLKILDIAGGAFCLSREPRGSRPDDRMLPSVGRDDLLDELMHTEQDAVLWGVPGSGKSHVAARLPGALFMEDQPTSERLLDDLAAAHPPVVVVDDAGGRLLELDRLIYARRAENLDFRVVVTCWPHQLNEVTDHLPEAQRFGVELLTREEMGILLRARGITRLSVLAQILAQGRPAWALNLADLLVRGGDWRSVWTGAAVRTQILAYLRRSGASPVALELLAAIGMLGEVTEDQVRRLGRLLEIPRFDLRRTIESVAVAGLLDVSRVSVPRTQRLSSNGAREDRYRVEPQVVAASIVADGYFAGRASVVSLGELRREFPEKRAQVLQTQIHCTLLGAEEPVVPTQGELVEALANVDSLDLEAELLRSYALLGHDQARFVIDLLAERAKTSWEAGEARATERETRMLAERVADLVHQGAAEEPVHTLLELLAELARDGFAYREALTTLVEEVRDARSGDVPEVTDLLRLAETVATMPAGFIGPTSTSVWVTLVADILAPTFDGNYMSPEVVRQFVLQSFTWPGQDLTALFETVRPALDHIVPGSKEDDVVLLLKLLGKWMRLAEGHGLPFGGQPTTGQRHAASRSAAQLASVLEQAIHRPGIRAQFNAIARPLGAQLDEPDTLFAVLTAERSSLKDWKTEARRADEELGAVLEPYLRQSPEVLMSWIARNEEDLQMAREGYGVISRVMRKVADEPDSARWLSAALQQGLGSHAALLIDTTVLHGGIDPSAAATLLGEPACRPALVNAVMRHDVDRELLKTVIERLTVDDLRGIDILLDVRQAAEPKLRLLFTHPEADIRGTAAALWAAEASLELTSHEDGPTLLPLWLEAVAEFKVPSVLDDYQQGQALTIIARIAPDIFVDLLATHAQAVVTHNDFREWSDGIRQLALDQRHRLWTRVAATRNARELFWAIAAGSAEWITSAFERKAVSIEPNRLLHAWRCQNGPGITFEDLARLFMPLGVEPDGLLWLLEVGTHVGEDHEQYVKHLEDCRALANSTNPDLARLGARGVQIYEPRLIESRQRARKAAIRGLLV